MLIISSIFCGMLISAILVAIISINIEKFLDSNNIDVKTHSTGLLLNIETDGKDKKDYNKYIRKIYLIFVIIFTILSYFILPKL